MLSRKERLSREEFNRFFSLGTRTHAAHFTLVYTRHNSLHASVVVSKKISGSAVVRNKIRRRMYESVHAYARTHGTIGVFIFIMKKGVDSLPFKVLTEEVHAKLTTITK